MRTHIYEQIRWRFMVMERKCFEGGECVKCGCSTTALQMCSKSCEKPCYPPLMSKNKWKVFLSGTPIKDDKDFIWFLNTEKYQLRCFIIKDNHYTKLIKNVYKDRIEFRNY